MQQARGEFDVKRSPVGDCDLGDGEVAAHVRFDKRFHGALDAASIAHMLAIGTAVPGSAAYVAIERIVGTLQGKAGSFCMQHGGTMARGKGTLALTVVPDSGSGELEGLAGRMAIDIVDGRHFYTFDYTFDANP